MIISGDVSFHGKTSMRAQTAKFSTVYCRLHPEKHELQVDSKPGMWIQSSIPFLMTPLANSPFCQAVTCHFSTFLPVTLRMTGEASFTLSINYGKKHVMQAKLLLKYMCFYFNSHVLVGKWAFL